MTTLDLTEHADEFREIAGDWCGLDGPLFTYWLHGEITSGLSLEIRRRMSENRTYGGSGLKAAHAYNLGRLLGHVAPLEDALKVGDL